MTPPLSLCEQPDSAPGPPDVGVPDVIANVTVDESAVTVFPPASCTATFGCVANAAPPVAPPGCWVNDSLAAAPVVTVNEIVFELVELPLSVAVARMLTVPTSPPVTVFTAMPPEAVASPVPVTDPVPP